MATVVVLYIKPGFLASVSPTMIDGTVNQTAQLISTKITETSQVLFSLLPVKHFLAHSLSIQITVNLPKTQLDSNIMAARWCSILCMVKTSGRAAGVRHKQPPGAPLPKPRLAAQPPISQISNLSPLELFHSKPLSLSLCASRPHDSEVRRLKRPDWGENRIVIVAPRQLTSCKSILAGLLNDIIMFLTVFGHWLSGQKWDDLGAW